MKNANTQGLSQKKDEKSADSGTVICFVSKKKVDRSLAKQIRHPTQGMVWVAEQYIK